MKEYKSLKLKKPMKRCSFKVANAIKGAGYPLERFQTVSREQFEAGHGYKYSTDKSFYSESPSILHPEDNNTIDMYYCPTYLEVWLWLWKEKRIYLNTNTERKGIVCVYWDDTIINEIKDMKLTDPEDAIAAAIEYIIDNDLIK